ncbi:hypothetical protein DOTSEDRAFT_26046 [Dothistroma septosporum NZE10]|uniref:Uncharacterized protein n=1 Tax=Dothistroma septosporum (strain NZE10 / CBS 128990) TaxID=675120 RepID=N1PIL4_DOTSN|nr:hypothetical protein DOTSEDRAFT_26046 [Dothistroma septosporum NZE10]
MTSFNLEIVNGPNTPGTTTDHELFFARRALALLKTRLGSEVLMSLLAPDTAIADTYWEDIIASSSGHYLPANITLRCHGLSVSSFLSWFKSKATDAIINLAGHPEHYLSTHGPILETIGKHVSFFTLQFTQEPDKCVTNRDAEKYPVVLSGFGTLRSGTVMGYACHQFRDLDGKREEEGLEAMFGAWVPADAGEEVRECHRMHLEVEWTNWLRAAYEDLHGEGR